MTETIAAMEEQRQAVLDKFMAPSRIHETIAAMEEQRQAVLDMISATAMLVWNLDASEVGSQRNDQVLQRSIDALLLLTCFLVTYLLYAYSELAAGSARVGDFVLEAADEILSRPGPTRGAFLLFTLWVAVVQSLRRNQ
jgi:hypothetical protein